MTGRQDSRWLEAYGGVQLADFLAGQDPGPALPELAQRHRPYADPNQPLDREAGRGQQAADEPVAALVEDELDHHAVLGVADDAEAVHACRTVVQLEPA